MKTTHRALGLVALLVLLCPLAVLAQATSRSQATYSGVQVVVKDLASGQDIGVIEPGGTFTLNEGQKVRLIMTATGGGKGTYYPETEFTEMEPGRGWVRVGRTSRENSSATLEIIRPSNANRNRTEALRYRITENLNIPSHLRQGTVHIRVEPGVASGVAPVTGGHTAQDTHEPALPRHPVARYRSDRSAVRRPDRQWRLSGADQGRAGDGRKRREPGPGL